MLETLPCEILMLIADWVSPACLFCLVQVLTARQLPVTTLRVLSRASSRLYAVLVPRIYRTVSFCAASEWALNVLDVDPFFRHLGPSRAADYL
jgi:hypothetical protein